MLSVSCRCSMCADLLTLVLPSASTRSALGSDAANRKDMRFCDKTKRTGSLPVYTHSVESHKAKLGRQS
jgi:hypothetical protein